MRLFLGLFMLEGLLSIILKDNISSDVLTTIWIYIDCIYLVGWFYRKSDNKTMLYILIAGLFIRLLAMVYDQNIARLPFNTADAYKFQEMAIKTAEALPTELLDNFTGFYSQVLGVIYYIFGVNIYLGHFLNIVFVVLAATKLIDIGHMLKLKTKNITILIGLWLFMPIPFLMGYALLREASIYYFVVLSAYYFLKWFEKYNPIYIILSLVAVAVGALYHEGVIAIAAAYIYTYLFYNKKKKKIPINILNIIFILIVVAAAFGYISKESEELLQKTNADTGGGSSYLTSVDITNPVQFIMLAPIKGFYLLFSPMPWLIRGFLDILTFVCDVSIWGLAIYTVIKNYKIVDTKYKMLIVSVIVAGIMFGMGTHNTGTAMRHRNKLVALVLIPFVAVKDKSEKKNSSDVLIEEKTVKEIEV